MKRKGPRIEHFWNDLPPSVVVIVAPETVNFRDVLF